MLIWPDNDVAGKGYAEAAARKLIEVGALPHLMLIPDGKPEKWDIADAAAEGWTKKQIDELISRAVLYEPSRPPKTYEQYGAYDAARLRTKVIPVLKEAVPDVFLEGLSVLAGPPKLGKSRLALNVACAVEAGGRALSYVDVEPGTVLYFLLCLLLPERKRKRPVLLRSYGILLLLKPVFCATAPQYPG